jgi:hypothetical protein
MMIIKFNNKNRENQHYKINLKLKNRILLRIFLLDFKETLAD